MSQRLCPKCNRQLKPNAQFCTYCGIRLELIGPPSAPKDDRAPEVPSLIQRETSRVEPISPADEAAFIMRGKLEKRHSEKTIVEEELETVRVKQLVGELTEEEAKAHIEQLQDRLAPITKEINEISKKAQTTLEHFRQEKNAQEERIQRLEELHRSGEVDDAVFQRLNDEYQSKFSEIKNQLESELAKTHQWHRQLEAQREQLEFDKETLQVRARIDKTTKSKVNKQLKAIDQQLTTVVSILAGLRAVLDHSTQQVQREKIPQPTRSAKESRQIPSNRCPHCNAKITPKSEYCYTCGRLIAG